MYLLFVQPGPGLHCVETERLLCFVLVKGLGGVQHQIHGGAR